MGRVTVEFAEHEQSDTARATTAWYRAQDALLALDAELGQVPGAAEQSAQMTRAIRRLRAEGDCIMAAARAAARAAE